MEANIIYKNKEFKMINYRAQRIKLRKMKLK